jgi:hypothetical protein
MSLSNLSNYLNKRKWLSDVEKRRLLMKKAYGAATNEAIRNEVKAIYTKKMSKPRRAKGEAKGARTIGNFLRRTKRIRRLNKKRVVPNKQVAKLAQGKATVPQILAVIRAYRLRARAEKQAELAKRKVEIEQRRVARRKALEEEAKKRQNKTIARIARINTKKRLPAAEVNRLVESKATIKQIRSAIRARRQAVKAGKDAAKLAREKARLNKLRASIQKKRHLTQAQKNAALARVGKNKPANILKSVKRKATNAVNKQRATKKAKPSPKPTKKRRTAAQRAANEAAAAGLLVTGPRRRR